MTTRKRHAKGKCWKLSPALQRFIEEKLASADPSMAIARQIPDWFKEAERTDLLDGRRAKTFEILVYKIRQKLGGNASKAGTPKPQTKTRRLRNRTKPPVRTELNELREHAAFFAQLQPMLKEAKERETRLASLGLATVEHNGDILFRPIKK